MVTGNSSELTRSQYTYNKYNDSILTKFKIGLNICKYTQITRSYMPETEAHSCHNPMSSVCVSPDVKVSPIKILKLFSLLPIIHIYVNDIFCAQNRIFLYLYVMCSYINVFRYKLSNINSHKIQIDYGCIMLLP